MISFRMFVAPVLYGLIGLLLIGSPSVAANVANSNAQGNSPGGLYGIQSSKAQLASSAATLAGVRTVWHVVELSFQHDTELVEGGTPNPFLDHRLNVLFTHADSGRTYLVPGFFDADGNAADSGTTKGDMFRVRFTPDLSGQWSWVASFREGDEVAIDTNPSAGLPASFDGESGSFIVRPADPLAPGLRSKGRLNYVNKRLLRFEWDQEYFLKGGTNSPENLLGYWEFDGTVDTGGDPNALDQIDGLHRFANHVGDYSSLGGGPTWKNGKGQGLLGGLNYLASEGVNSIFFLTYNIDGGDGGEVYPWSSTISKLRYDVSKLSQWERVFDHMTDLGIVMHVALMEEENDNTLDNGSFGDQRMLYHREMVARFGCSLGLVWNIGEETSLNDSLRKTSVSHLRSIDPYDHPIAIHTAPDDLNAVYGALLGYPDVELCSLQILPEESHERTNQWGSDSAGAGRPWIVTVDEQNPPNDGVVPDTTDPDHFETRCEVLWGNLTAGGGGAEYYFGYAWADNDLDCEDWRSRGNMWEQTTLALDFMRTEVDYLAMNPADELTTQPEHFCMAEKGDTYLVYTPDGSSPVLDLEGNTGSYWLRWFDVKSGGGLQLGQLNTVRGPGPVSLGLPPSGGQDWVALLRTQNLYAPTFTSHGGEATIENGLTTALVEAHVDDRNGPSDILLVAIQAFDPLGNNQGLFLLNHVSGDLYTTYVSSATGFTAGSWTYTMAVVDKTWSSSFVSGSFVAP